MGTEPLRFYLAQQLDECRERIKNLTSQLKQEQLVNEILHEENVRLKDEIRRKQGVFMHLKDLLKGGEIQCTREEGS